MNYDFFMLFPQHSLLMDIAVVDPFLTYARSKTSLRTMEPTKLRNRVEIESLFQIGMAQLPSLRCSRGKEGFCLKFG